MEAVEIPASVRRIGISAFCNCKKLRKLVIRGADSAETTEGCCGIFSHSSSGRSRLRVIDRRAFYGCCSLRSVRFPAGLRKIGSHCFSESGLEALVLPPSVRKIGVSAFEDCK